MKFFVRGGLWVFLIVLGISVRSQQICAPAALPATLRNGLVAFYPFCGDALGGVVHVQPGEYGSGIQRVKISRSGAWSVAGTSMVQVELDGEVRNMPVVLGSEDPSP